MPRPPCRPARATLGTLLVTVLSWVTGCEIHDETVASPRATRPWRAPAEPSGRRDDRRQESTAGSRIEYVEGYEAGRRRATAGGLPMLLVFRASWCRWSAELAKGPLADRDLVTLSRLFVCVTIDADRDPATCTAFGVTGFPTVILVDEEERTRFRATGSMSAGSLTFAMHDLLGNAARSHRVATGVADGPRR